MHILSLVSELKHEVEGGRIVSTEFYRKERAAYFIIKNKQRLALSFVYHPVKWGTYLIPASRINLETREKPYPIFDIEGAVVAGVEQRGLDRIFHLTLEKDKKTYRLLFEAIGPNGNVWLLDKHDIKLATLRKKEFQAGDKYEPFSPPERLDPAKVTAEQLENLAGEHPGVPPSILVERYVQGFSDTLAREITSRAGLDNAGADQLDPTSLETLAKTIRDLSIAFERFDTGYLYTVRGKHEAYPFKLSSSDQQPQKLKSLSLAVMSACEMRQTVTEQEDEEKIVGGAVKRAIKRLEKKLVNIEKDISEASNYEQYKKLGELLKINFDSVKKGMTAIEVNDIYTDSGETITIDLDPALSPNENAEAYFKRYRKGREGLELLERRLKITGEELVELRDIEAELDRDFDSARSRYEQEIASLLPKEASKTEIAPRLPYREFTLSTGLRIFVGRDGADNDRTTFEFARPYELWFHTQQCAGSHVVMKFPNKSFEPSKKEIEETAAIAAYFSKARKDSLVPVLYTPRKYVRKPRKAKPGLVTVEREKSVMVEPAKPSDE
ncbi:MAG: NFACT family protein [Candidatus Zixiibacteriota bacterium]